MTMYDPDTEGTEAQRRKRDELLAGMQCYKCGHFARSSGDFVHDCPDQQEPVTQADRDAAASLYGNLFPWADCFQGARCDKIRAGEWDMLELVQAFARHRQQAIAPPDVTRTDLCNTDDRQDTRPAALGEDEALAHVLWLHEAKRAAPNVAKYRTLEAFRNDLNAKDRAVWLDQAAAALSYLSPRLAQQAEEVARLKAAAHPIMLEISAEIENAVRKFPTWPTRIIDAGNVVSEESGELAKACLQVVYEPHKETMAGVRSEAIQTAAMAIRFIASMDVYDTSPGEQHKQPSFAIRAHTKEASDAK